VETKRDFQVEITKSADSSYDGTFIMSASSPDRTHDTIDVKAYQPNLGKKLIALWQHKQDQPVGFFDNLRIEGDALVGDLKVASTNLGKMIKQLIQDSCPLGASIGFRGQGERRKSGQGIHFKQIELLECSVVSVPAHPRAQLLAKSLGLEEFIDTVESNDDVEDMTASGRCMDETVRKAKAAILAAQKSIRK